LSAASDTLATELRAVCGERLALHVAPNGEITAEVPAADLLAVAQLLRDAPTLQFAMLIDVAGVDYLDYGRTEWRAEQATGSGFSRGVDHAAAHTLRGGRRYAVAYQLLSLTHNRRLRLRAWCEGEEDPAVDSLTGIWPSANWFEREAFDLFGILFQGHPDLRRLLTDYGFIGHPFRKDFPLIGNVEVRYDPAQQRVVYEPVTIEARTLVPRVIRHDNRYEPALKDAPAGGGPGGASG
jgi:NADH-quinone oxidoreductase subunit C